MKSKPDFDPDWPASSRRRLWPIRSIWQLMAVVAVSGLVLAASVTMARQPLSSVVYWDPSLAPSSAERARLVFYPAPDMAQESLVIACPIDPQTSFVIPDQMRHPDARSAPESIDPEMIRNAPESIDPKMVVRAPEWIDPKMVFIPGGAGEQAEQGGMPELAPGVPGTAPGTSPRYEIVPFPDSSSPSAKRPRFRLVPVPDGSSPPAKKVQPRLVPVPEGSSPPARKPRQKLAPVPGGSSPAAPEPRP